MRRQRTGSEPNVSAAVSSVITKKTSKALRRLRNIAQYGIGDEGRARKQQAKAAARAAAFQSENWQREQAVARRSYGSYEDYLAHQESKLERVEDRLHETESQDLAEFQRRFAGCKPLTDARTVLCLGARLGTEVKALHALGYFAVGIDLNPGQSNAYVLTGDFHNIVFPDGSVDAVYCNALDHVFDLGKLLAEINRILSPRGLFLADLLKGFEEGFTPGQYESIIWRKRQDFIDEIARVGNMTVEQVTDLGPHRRDHWTQVVFRKAN